jgi:hypothetical protein
MELQYKLYKDNVELFAKDNPPCYVGLYAEYSGKNREYYSEYYTKYLGENIYVELIFPVTASTTTFLSMVLSYLNCHHEIIDDKHHFYFMMYEYDNFAHIYFELMFVRYCVRGMQPSLADFMLEIYKVIQLDPMQLWCIAYPYVIEQKHHMFFNPIKDNEYMIVRFDDVIDYFKKFKGKSHSSYAVMSELLYLGKKVPTMEKIPSPYGHGCPFKAKSTEEKHEKIRKYIAENIYSWRQQNSDKLVFP